MKAFARNRNARPADAPAAGDEAAVGDTPEQANEDFLARLGDLDQFIGAGTAAPAGLATPVAPRLPSVSEALRNQSAAPREPLPEVTGDPRRLYATTDPAAAPAPAEDEAADFLQRLGDLDRFIGTAPEPAPAPRPATPAAAGPAPSPAARPEPATRPAPTAPTGRTVPACPVCRGEIDPTAPTTVAAVEQLRRADGSIVECPPLAFHANCWTARVGDFRRIS